ncbi:hypothetical protein FHB04_16205 [Escherichia coli]|nr:hypothetical protein [Escherichia coli]
MASVSISCPSCSATDGVVRSYPSRSLPVTTFKLVGRAGFEPATN